MLCAVVSALAYSAPLAPRPAVAGRSQAAAMQLTKKARADQYAPAPTRAALLCVPAAQAACALHQL